MNGEISKIKLDLNSAFQFLQTLYSPFSSRNKKPAYIEIRGKKEDGPMSFRRFFRNPEALRKDMGRWNFNLNYWFGVATRRDTKGGTKENLLAMPAAFCDVDCGAAGHKNAPKYQTKVEALAAIEAFPLRPSLLIDSGGGYQCYWIFQEPLFLSQSEISKAEAINRGLAEALEGDLPATDAARIFRLPGTYNQKLAGNPRPVKIVWCEPERVYDLATFAQYEAQGQKQSQERQSGHQAGTVSGPESDYAAYAQKALADEIAKVAGTSEGGRNAALNQAGFALGSLVAAGVLDRGSVEAALTGVAASIGLGEAEARATIRSGIEAGMKQPRQLPERNAQGLAQRRRQTTAGDDEPERIPWVGHYYFEEFGRHCLETYDRQGAPQARTLTNFSGRITDDISRDDGLKTIREFRIEGKLDNGRPLPPAQIPAKEFDSLSWIRREWGAAASVAPGTSLRPHVCNAISAHSNKQGVNRKIVYAHTGCRKINGVWRYLHGAGALGNGEPVETDLGENLGLYQLPAPGGADAAAASLRFLEIAPWEVTAPLLACAYLAPFADMFKIDFSLWMYGPTGSMKSTLAALTLCHFGNFDRRTLPGSWFSTVNSLEKLCFTLKDSLLIIDDFMPASNLKESQAMGATAGRLMYQAGNRSARGRLAPDMTARANYYPRCLILSTGETLLPGQRQSATARYLGIELDPKKTPIDKARLTEAQEEAYPLYAAAMARYLVDILPRLDDFLEEIRDLWTGYRKAFQNGSHQRIPEIQAWLAVGFDLFLRFQSRLGVISSEDAYEFLKAGWKVFQILGEKHGRIIEGERPTLKFLSVLAELFLTSRVYAESKTYVGVSPPGKLSLGWDGTEPAKNAFKIGWADEEWLYLLPETGLRVVSEAIRAQGDFLSLGRNELWAALAREDLIAPGAGGRSTRQVRIQGGVKRVICLPLSNLIQEDKNLIEEEDMKTEATAGELF